MQVAHSWRLRNALGKVIAKKSDDDPMAAAVALERRYRGLREWVNTMSQTARLEVAHPANKPWAFDIHFEYVDRGGDHPLIEVAELRILPRRGPGYVIPAINLLRHRAPDLPALTQYIRNCLPVLSHA